MEWCIEKGINVFLFCYFHERYPKMLICVIMPCVSASVILSYLHSRPYCNEKVTLPPANNTSNNVVQSYNTNTTVIWLQKRAKLLRKTSKYIEANSSSLQLSVGHATIEHFLLILFGHNIDIAAFSCLLLPGFTGS